MDEGTLPDWLTENDDGSMTITFERRPPKIDGTEVAELTMREPTVQDQLTADKSTKHRGDQEVSLLANLLELAPEAVSSMSLRNYGRLQDAYAVFTR